MRSSKLSYFLAFVLLLSIESKAQVGQVINIASRYATLLKSYQNDIIYASDNSEAEFEEHLHIAILPFAAHISYVNPREIDEEEALEQFESEQMLGKMLQEQFWDVFDNYDSEVYLQDIRITNKILQDIGYFARKDQFPPSYLAQILQVDAVILCTFDIQIDNTRSGWQNLTKALGGLAMSQVTGFVPGLDALSFIQDPSAIIKIVSNPGEFYQKLKSGDLTVLVDVAGTMLPEGNWKKVATLVANNSQTINRVMQGDTKNLFGDLISNNISMISSELNLNPTVSRLISNNTSIVNNVISGNTQGLMFDIISNNVNTFTSEFIDSKNSLLSEAISNNSTIIAKLASGDTSNLLQDVLSNNISQISGLAGSSNQSFYTDLIINNKDIIGKVVSGDFNSIANELISNNLNLLGEVLPENGNQLFTSLISKKDAVESLLDGDFDSIFNTLTESGVELLGAEFEGTDIEKFANIISENKGLIKSIASGDKNELLKFAFQNSSSLLGETLDLDQANDFVNIINNKGSLIQDMINGDSSQLLSGFLIGFDPNLDLGKASQISSVLMSNKDIIPIALKGNKEELLKLVPDNKVAEYLIQNKSNLNQLIGLSQTTDFSILGKSEEDLEVLSYQLMENPDVIGGIISGDSGKIITGFSSEQSGNNLQGDSEFIQELSKSLINEKTQISNVLVNSKINQMLLNGMIDIQFFDFGVDALLEEYENVYLRDKTVSQTLASILDPSTDPQDSTKVTINIFSKDSDEILWQYINQHDKARLYDMNRTVSKIINRVNKRFPYFTN